MRTALLVTVAGLLAAAPALAEEYFGGELQVVGVFDPTTPGYDDTQVLTPDYSNVGSFLGQAFVNGGATTVSGNTITRLVADDITPSGVHAGLDVTQLKFSMANLNASAVSVRPRIRFWFANGAGGGPGSYYNVPANVGFSFNPITLNAGSVVVVTANLVAGTFTMPGTTFWAGVTFDNNTGATGASVTQMNNIGQGLFDPPAVGASTDAFFLTSTAGSFFPTANPAGSFSNFGGNPVGNFGWEFSVDAPVPVEASSWGRIKAQYQD